MTQPAPAAGRAVFDLLQPFAYGRGGVRLFKPDPGAAGAAWQFKVPPGGRLRILVLRVNVHTDVNAGSRLPIFRYMDTDNNELFSMPTQTNVPTGQDRAYSFTPLLPYVPTAAANVNAYPIPGLFLQPSWRIQVDLNGGFAGDLINQVSLWCEQFFDDDTGYPLGSVAAGEQLPTS